MLGIFVHRLLSRSFGIPARRPQGFRPRFEALEHRCVPAFTTSFDIASGALTVTGSAGADAITITEDGARSERYYVREGGVNTAQSFDGVKSIAIDMKGSPAGSDDTVTFVGSNVASTVLSGALSITGSGGLKASFGSDFNVRGAVNIATTSSVGRLTVQTGTAAQFDYQSNVTLGAITITNRGAGGAFVDLAGNNANDVGIAGPLSATLGSGVNRFVLFNAKVAGGVTESGAGAADNSSLISTNVGGFVSFNGTDVNSGVVATILDSTIGTFFSVASGNGADTVKVDSTAVLGLGLQPQQQTFGVDLKGGTNKSFIGIGGADAKNVIHGSLFHYGAGAETFDLRNYTITSFVTVNAQAGNGGVTATIKDSKISNFLSLAAAGASNDNVTVDNLSIGQNFAMDLGGGTNTTIITNCTYLGSYSEVDSGIDVVTFTGNTGFGDVRWSANILRIGDGKFFNDRIAGNATFISTQSGSIDVVYFGPEFGTPVSAANAVSVGKTLTINLGTTSTGIGLSNDSASATNVIVKGDVTVTALTINFTNMSIGGNLTVSAGAASASATIQLGSYSDANSGSVRIVGNLAITTGTGNDAIAIVDATIDGTTTLNTNAGNDSVNLEWTDGKPGPSQFFGAIQVNAGDDNDTITAGADAANSAQFFSAVIYDGGIGNDTLNEVYANYYGGAPTRSNIP